MRDNRLMSPWDADSEGLASPQGHVLARAPKRHRDDRPHPSQKRDNRLRALEKAGYEPLRDKRLRVLRDNGLRARWMRIVKVLPPRRGTSFPARRNVMATIVPALVKRERIFPGVPRS